MTSVINSAKFENKMVANSSKLFQKIEHFPNHSMRPVLLWYWKQTLISQEDYRPNMSNENICKILSNWI